MSENSAPDVVLSPLSKEAMRAEILAEYRPGDQLVLRGAATVRSFDCKLLEDVIAAGVSDRELNCAALAGEYFVEPSPGPGPRYRLAGAYRKSFFNTWWPSGAQETASTGRIPDGLRALSQRLADHFAALGDEGERLYHLALADPDAATDRFVAAFDEAEKAFDLPRCRVLVNLLEERRSERAGLFTTRLSTELDLRRQRLAARSRWEHEYYQTVPYLLPERLTGVLEDLLAEGPRWVLHLHAPGGMGKTMFIRHAITRHCIPHRIPVAHIDFDFAPHQTGVVEEAHRLLALIAQQLNDQIPNYPYREFLDLSERMRIRPWFSGPLGPTPGAPLTLTGAEKQDLIDRFVAPLTLVQTGPLLILDTLELLAHRTEALEQIYKLLKRLHTAQKGLRVILAGRTNLTCRELEDDALQERRCRPEGDSRYSAFTRTFWGGARVLRLRPFSEEDARTYLTKKRGMATGPRVEAVIKSGRGNPFKLALLADLTIEDNLDVAAIRKLPDAEIAYLIDRVILRISDVAVRWTLRYGVVPRLLTRDFLDSVLAPYVGAVLSGSLSDDDPSQDPIGTARQKLNLFHPLREGETPPAMDDVWRGLLAYAAEASWMSTSKDAPDALVILPDARLPLRGLLRQQEARGNNILTVLHHKAWEHFDRLGHQAPERADLWLPEALYHKYQSGGEHAPAYCRGLLQEWAANTAVTTALAEELLRPPERIPGGGAPVSDYGADVRSLAATLLSERALEAGNITRAELLIRRAESLNADAARGAQGTLTAVPRLAELAATVALARGDSVNAIEVISQALERGADEGETLRLKAVLARAQLAQGGADTLDIALQVWELAVKAQSPRAGELAGQIIARLRSAERYTEMTRVLETSYPVVLQHSLDGGAAMAIELIQTLQSLGRDKAAAEAGARALKAVEARQAAQHAPDADTFWTACLTAAIALAEWRVGRAGQALAAWLAPGRGRARLSPVRNTALSALEQDLLARSWDIDELAASNEASRAVAVSPRERGLRLIRVAEAYLYQVTDFVQAERYHKMALSELGAAGDAALLPVALALDVHGGRLADARAKVSTLLDGPATVGACVPVLLEAIRLELDKGLDAAAQAPQAAAPAALLAVLQEVTPPTRRLVLLDGLERCPRWPNPATLKEIAALLPRVDARGLAALLPKARAEGQDPAVAKLRLAELERVSGRDDHAHRLIDQAADDARRTGRPALLREALRARDRLSWTWEGLQAAQASLAEMWKVDPTPALEGLAWLEQAERLVKAAGAAPGQQESSQALDPNAAGLCLQWAEESLTTAARLLDDPVTVWKARIATARARLAAARGDVPATERAADTAAEFWRAMGNDDAAQQVLSVKPAPPPKDVPVPAVGPDSTGRQAPRAVLQIQEEQGRRLSLTWLMPDGIKLSRTPRSSAMTDPATGLREIVTNWRGACDQLSRLVLEGPKMNVVVDRPESMDLELVTSQRLAWLPWEMALLGNRRWPPDAGVHWLWRSMHRAPAAVEGRGSEPCVVVFSQLVSTGMRGLESDTGDVAAFYATRGIRVERAEDVGIFQEMLAKLRPRVVHVTAGLVETRGQAGLRLQEDYYAASKMNIQSNYSYDPFRSLPAKELGRMLRKSRATPLVILDILAPPVDHELVDQLRLRNMFAAEWADLEPPPAILATGLADWDQRVALLDALTGLLAQDLPIGEIHRAIPEHLPGPADEAMGPAIARLGAALFTSNPGQRFRVGAYGGAA